MTLKLLLVPLVCCAAYSQGTTPPPIIRIVTAPGAYPNPRPAYDKGAVDVIGLNAATGAPRTWWIEMHPTFASIEGLDQAMKGTPLVSNDSRAMIGLLQPGGSYLPEEAVRSLPKARYMRVTIYRIRPGTANTFAGVAQNRKVAGDQIDAGRADLLYHVVSGDDVGTYIVLSPLATLAALDPLSLTAPQDVPKETEIENSREHYLFSVTPWLSHVSTDFANGDPSFWRP